MIETGAIPLAVSVAEFRERRAIVAEDQESDTAFEALIAAAQSVIETGARRILAPRVVAFDTRAGCGRRWFVPMAPVLTIQSLHYQDDAGAWQEIPAAEYRLEMGESEPQVILTAAALAGVPDGAVLRFELSCGAYDHSLIQAVIALAGEWHLAGIEAERASAAGQSFGVTRTMRQKRYMRPSEWAAR